MHETGKWREVGQVGEIERRGDTDVVLRASGLVRWKEEVIVERALAEEGNANTCK